MPRDSSRFHFARVFKALTGVTPMAWQRARRGERFGRALQSGATVTAAIYDAGFNSPSRVYEGGAAFAMTPSAYRRRGAGETLRIATAPCALGTVVVAATAKGVCAIELGDDAAALESRVRARFSGATFIAADAQFDAWIAAVVRHLDRARGALELPLDLRGTAFQQRVWQALREIPAGSTASYAEVARRIGAPKAARGVAQACAANPAAVAVPCHRVVRGDGEPGGYRWGLERKRKLLDDEPATSRLRPRGARSRAGEAAKVAPSPGADSARIDPPWRSNVRRSPPAAVLPSEAYLSALGTKSSSRSRE